MDMLLPKDLTLALNFIKTNIYFSHRLFEESLPGHFGLITQFVLSELYGGHDLEHIAAACPFDVSPIIERMEQLSLIYMDSLTGLGKHYAFCLTKIHNKQIQAWVHCGRSLKILFPIETRVLTKELDELKGSMKIFPYENRVRHFAFSLQKDVQEFLKFLVPEYAETNETERSADIWNVRSYTERLDNTCDDISDEHESMFCVISLPKGLSIDHHAKNYIPVYLPSLKISTEYKHPEQDKYITADATIPVVLQEEICLLTGELLTGGDSSLEHNFKSDFEWPDKDWISDLAPFVSCEEQNLRLLSRSISMEMLWRSRKLASASVLEAIATKYPSDSFWSKNSMKEGD